MPRLRPLSEKEVRRRLRDIQAKGWIASHRRGDTGVGKTLEDEEGIAENNSCGPDNKFFELKSARANSPSKLTLFTKSPLPSGANSLLLDRYGYSSGKGGRKKLHVTVFVNRLITIRGKIGFKVAIKTDKVTLVSARGKELGYWDKETLRARFEAKYPALLLVKAESRRKGKFEEFKFVEAWFLWGFSFEKFVKLLKEDTITTDVRIGGYPRGHPQAGSPHDHGTGFRVKKKDLDECFSHRVRII